MSTCWDSNWDSDSWTLKFIVLVAYFYVVFPIFWDESYWDAFMKEFDCDRLMLFKN